MREREYHWVGEAMALAGRARALGVRLIGGCCGTTPAHLDAMRKALIEAPRNPRPNAETISARIAQAMAQSGSADD